MSESVTAPADAGGEQHDAPIAAPVEQAAPLTIRDTAEAAYDALVAREAEDEPTRGPNGQFASKQNDPAPEAAAQPDRLAPPEGFGDKAQVDWNRLPRSVQEGILSRVSAAPAAPPPDAYTETARNLRGAFEQHGLIPERALPEIVGAWQELVRNPAQVLPELAKRFGVELGQPAATQQPQQQGDQWVDPNLAALRSELAELKAAHETRTRQEQARAEAEKAQLYKSVSSDLESFAKDKPDFAALRTTMGRLIASGEAEGLEDAYEKAAWANPSTRAARIEAQRKEEEAKRMATAETARRSAAVNVRSDSRANPAPAKTMRETMERVADGLFTA
jgi:hypothetical protein